jgi:hypothetical protein
LKRIFGADRHAKTATNTLIAINFNYIVLEVIGVYMTTVQTNFTSGAEFFIADTVIFRLNNLRCRKV